MTRKDFQLVAMIFRAEIDTARAFHEEHGAAAIVSTAVSMADAFDRTYPRFDRDRFLDAACGINA